MFFIIYLCSSILLIVTKFRLLVFTVQLSLILFAGCAQNSTILQIVETTDIESGLQVPQVNVFVRSEDIKPGEDGGIFISTQTPIYIPIEVGKCTYVLIEAEGYHDWEEAFCPTDVEGIYVNIELVPKPHPPLKKQET